MILTEYKTAHQHYFRDEDGNIHGLFLSFHDNGAIALETNYNHGLKHGELKFFYVCGSLIQHRWYEHGTEILDFLAGDKYPTDEEELLIFKLTYQGEFIPNETNRI